MVEPDIALVHQAVGPRTESPWQSQARLLQSLWRQRQRLAAGGPGPRDGVLLTEADGADLRNLLSAPARRSIEQSRAFAEGGAQAARRALQRELLSTQVLCHNLFGPIAEQPDDPRAAEALRLLDPDVAAVERVIFDVESRRGSAVFIGRPARFHLVIDVRDAKGAPHALAVKVRYHEGHAGGAVDFPESAVELMRRSGAFGRQQPVDLPARVTPLLREHLLTMAMSHHARRRTRLVYLYPLRHERAAGAVAAYREHLRGPSGFGAHTLEDLVGALRWAYGERWVEDVYHRYLDPAPLRKALRT